MRIVARKRDTVAINEGQWVGEIPKMGSVRLKVRGRETPLFQAAFDKHLRAVPTEMRDRVGVPTGPARVHAMGLACHETVLLDWDGIEDEKGKPVKYRRDLALEWMTNPDFEHFLEAVLFAAVVVDTSNTRAAEALEKN
ncbi:MAG: hypothetical protein AB7I50_26570 [Vicinamibacterales bacterium]